MLKTDVSDSGIYICIARNNAGTAIGQVRLQVSGRNIYIGSMWVDKVKMCEKDIIAGKKIYKGKLNNIFPCKFTFIHSKIQNYQLISIFKFKTH